jgi:hypothetical protein
MTKESNLNVVGEKLLCFTRAQLFDGSSTQSHLSDLKTMVQDDELAQFMMTSPGVIKPVVFLLTDGGPDENPRHMKNVEKFCDFFKEMNLDYLSVRTHAPGQSAYNPVERSMSGLSGSLVGVVLPHDHYGNHLKSNGTVIDVDLAKSNFRHAAEMLGQYWTQDNHFDKPVYDKDVEPTSRSGAGCNPDLRSSRTETIVSDSADSSEDGTAISQICFAWIEAHCKLGRYSLDVRKCSNRLCCKDTRSSFSDNLKQFDGFIPALVPQINEHFLPVVSTLGFNFTKEQIAIFKQQDAYCPSLKTTYQSHCCESCGVYFPVKMTLSRHYSDITNPCKKHRRVHGRATARSVATEDIPEILVRFKNPYFLVEETSAIGRHGDGYNSC